jgi:dipeptidyl aminopeptidase/acylaminoacyl peptidase
VKAAHSNKWIIKRESTTSAPNYFLTRDFENYTQLTNLQPQESYNWLTAELHSFKQLDGTISQGILYKPENFNPAFRYPIIISFYGSLSQQLYQYPKPLYLTSPSVFDEPAWFVSHGYLVFTPDVYFTVGQWGPSVLNTIEGAGKYLRSLSFVDGKHIGVSGHSNSGRFGYYILTHSKSFAAMSIGSGHLGTDYLSGALSINERNGTSELEWAENLAFGSGGLGNIWQNKDLWLDHTAVLNADKVTSPLLLFHCKKDGDVVRLAAELFISLRRLNKKAWWLQYDDGSHRISQSGKDSKDYTIRYTQFYDHYLKGAPPPKWMTEGLPYNLKGIELKYELDPNGTCGSDCNKCRTHK